MIGQALLILVIVILAVFITKWIMKPAEKIVSSTFDLEEAKEPELSEDEQMLINKMNDLKQLKAELLLKSAERNVTEELQRIEKDIEDLDNVLIKLDTERTKG